MKAEPRVQRRFRVATAAAALVLASAVLLAHRIFSALPDREPLDPAVTTIQFEPAPLKAADFAPLRLVGAWKLSSDDPRFGGISAVAVAGDDLVALSDTGAVIRLPKPGTGRSRAHVRDLPDGPGDPRFKKNRDSEAIASDPSGRGWWVAFENRNALWLYDPVFERALEQEAIPGRGLSWNTGIEGLAAQGQGLLLLPEKGGRLLRRGESGWSEVPFNFPATRVSGAASLPGHSLLVIERRPVVVGFANALVRLDRCGSAYCLAWRKRLPVGLLDNVEAIAVEPLGTGAMRLWLVTDDGFRRPFRTLLIVADLPLER